MQPVKALSSPRVPVYTGKYNTLIFEKKFCKGTSFVLKRYYFGTIYRILYSSIVTLTALVRLSSNLSFYQLLCKFLSLSSFVLQSFLNLIHSFEDICYCFCLIHRPLCRYILISCRYILCKEFYKCPSYKWLYKEYLWKKCKWKPELFTDIRWRRLKAACLLRFCSVASFIR